MRDKVRCTMDDVRMWHEKGGAVSGLCTGVVVQV